ncbi:hypothetical protein [Nitrococcus mobilis]|nr:hypothetical protein [Nitrococcus mobilis]
MKNTPLKTMTMIAALLAVSSATSAANLGFLRNTLIRDLSDSDWQQLVETTIDALENAPDGATREWRNADTGHFGSIRVVKTFEAHDLPCRKVTLTNHTTSQTGPNAFTLCKVEGQGWRLLE